MVWPWHLLMIDGPIGSFLHWQQNVTRFVKNSGSVNFVFQMVKCLFPPDSLETSNFLNLEG